MPSKMVGWASIILAIIPSAMGHVAMTWPVPFDKALMQQYEGRSPLTTSNYPCNTNDFTITDEHRSSNTLHVSQAYDLSFDSNAAPHDGGSCQLSITLDEKPSRESVFKVFTSIEGGCPSDNAVTPKNQTFMLPEYIPKGDVVFAWTWFPRHSGSPEMYMNCAPIHVPDGSDDHEEFNKLPDMLVANIPSTQDASLGIDQRIYLDNGNIPPCDFGTDRVLRFPNPGEMFYSWTGGSDQETSDTRTGSLVTLTACGTSVTHAFTPFATAGQMLAASVSAEPTNAGSGGDFIELSATAASATPTTFSNILATDAAGETPASTADEILAVTPVNIPAAATSISGSSNPCNSASSGELVCNGTSQFGLCNWGTVVWQAVAAGTVCENGSIKAEKKVRAAEEIVQRRSHLHSNGRLSGRRQFHA
ncbi:Chitin-binding domain 3 [Neofusicoccum parvum]|uniref:Chitin-binding domain 3 n=1 Tax=Neofusicoccum parvum TaxID=310453 RepID=A0ACB5S0K6_9PEZI|nr:Chitin-binding domain 3 [Neofusicoccum parvum]